MIEQKGLSFKSKGSDKKKIVFSKCCQKKGHTCTLSVLEESVHSDKESPFNGYFLAVAVALIIGVFCCFSSIKDESAQMAQQKREQIRVYES